MQGLTLYQRVNKSADIKAKQKEVKKELLRLESENRVKKEKQQAIIHLMIIVSLIILGGFADGLFL